MTNLTTAHDQYCKSTWDGLSSDDEPLLEKRRRTGAYLGFDDLEWKASFGGRQKEDWDQWRL